ncbi:MAG: histidine kinase dimerization/phosphoacceptor domain -containing protein [Pseudomonadota bacterium]|nr:histidine kinase dimerization/phosphoacceptor domain -containing protein [Pseudomonadota bacterium]
MDPDHRIPHPLAAYGLAVGVWLIAFLVRLGLDHQFPPGFPYLTFFPAVVVATYLAGLRAGLLTAVLSGLTAWWFFIGPPGFELNAATGLALLFYAFVVAVDIFFIDGMHRERRRAEAEIEHSRELAESRDLLSREIQHRVSNNLQVVSAMLALQAQHTSDPDARRGLQEARGRTALIAKVQRGLHDANGQALPFAVFARDLLDDALDAAGRTDVELTVTGGERPLSQDQSTPVSLIMLECVNNALEHGFSDRAGVVRVDLSMEGPEAVLTVTDDGAGLSPGFDPARVQSLGLRIVHSMARQLGGRFEMTGLDRGVRSRLIFPTSDRDAPAIL